MKKTILIILILLFTSGCIFKNNNKESVEIKDSFGELSENCEKKAKELDKICLEENITSLDLDTLKNCNYIKTNRERYLKWCDFDSTFLLDFLLDEETNNEINNKFYKEIKDRCDKVIGSMTIKEFDFCMKKFSNTFTCDMSNEDLATGW